MLIGCGIVNLCSRDSLQSYCKIWLTRTDEYPMKISLLQTSVESQRSLILGQMKIHKNNH